MGKVLAYRNLNRKGVVWSLKSAKTGLVVARVTQAYFRFVELKVSAAGRKRVLKQKRKNVHAFVKGDKVLYVPPYLKWKRVSYNPYKNETFVDTKGKPVLTAQYAVLKQDGLWVANKE